eukprot:GFUD01003041.1.p1 GENE.GFUD01003041.1~~GFUD01003041.1.p1  ORF type:complete len:196 (+),score=37.88 GFUD01003041.1:111-698(+)
MAVWSMNDTQDVAKTTRKTQIFLRIFIGFDLFFIISAALNLIWLSPSEARNVYFGHVERSFILLIIGIFSTSSVCNSLAVVGVSTWKRGCLIPWLLFFLAVKIFLVIGFINNVLNNPVNLGQLIHLLLILSIMSAWKHMQTQYIIMGLPRPAQVVTDSETASSDQNVETAGDLPPKYEDVAETPPKYDETMMKPN